MTENRIFTLCRMITWVVFLRLFWNFISSLPVKRGGSLSFLVGAISNVLVMEICWTDVGSGGYILVSCAHSNTSCKNAPPCPLIWKKPTLFYKREGHIEHIRIFLRHIMIYIYIWTLWTQSHDKLSLFSLLRWAVQNPSGNPAYDYYSTPVSHIFLT
jgi:hypothetical protein